MPIDFELPYYSYINDNGIEYTSVDINDLLPFSIDKNIKIEYMTYSKKILSIEWYKNSVLHNETEYSIYYEQLIYPNYIWYTNGARHNMCIPSNIKYMSNGNIDEMIWHNTDLLHRDNNKLAYICYDELTGEYISYNYYNNDVEYFISTYNTNIDIEISGYLYKCNLYKIDDVEYNIKITYDYHNDGNITALQWFKNENKHRNNKPAQIFFCDGDVEKNFWYYENKLHREDGPAEIQYYESGKIKEESWYKENKLYNGNNQFTVMSYNEDGTLNYLGNVYDTYYYHDGISFIRYENNLIKFVLIYKNRKYIIDKPSYISFYDNGNIENIEWRTNRYEDNTWVFRPNGKASRIEFTTDGNINEICFIQYETFHRLNGPAIIRYDNNVIYEYGFYINDTKYTYTEWLEYYKKTPEYQTQLKKEAHNIFN